jgi:hypothetical protein
MRSKDVIQRAPVFVCLAAWLSVAAQYSSGPATTVLNTCALIISSATLGALGTHFPSTAR